MASPTPNTSLGPSELWASPPTRLKRGQALEQRARSDLWEVSPSLCCWVRVCTTTWIGNCFLGFTTLCDKAGCVACTGCARRPCGHLTPMQECDPSHHILLELSLWGPGLCGDMCRMQLSYPWGYTNLSAALFLLLFAKFLLGHCKEHTLQKNLSRKGNCP